MVAQHQMTSGFKGGGQRSDDKRGRREPKASRACLERTNCYSNVRGWEETEEEE